MSGFPSVFPDSCVGLSPIGMGCLPSFLGLASFGRLLGLFVFPWRAGSYLCLCSSLLCSIHYYVNLLWALWEHGIFLGGLDVFIPRSPSVQIFLVLADLDG